MTGRSRLSSACGHRFAPGRFGVFYSAFRLGGITKAIRNRYLFKKLEHFPDHKSLQLLWEML
jgi:hypothetical protein